ncbi:MAG: DUF2391 family protein [Campylobacterales bacterium]|nr:DUF2391 family protein [Campylobacterales bacterium]
MNFNINLEDIAQIIIGAFVLAVPISFSEEAWRLGETLPLFNLFLIVTLSVSFLALFAYQSVFQGNIVHRNFIFIFRVVVAYLITLCVVLLVLLSLDKFPLLTEPILAIKRLIIIAMPASMGAIVVDSFDKE